MDILPEVVHAQRHPARVNEGDWPARRSLRNIPTRFLLQFPDGAEVPRQRRPARVDEGDWPARRPLRNIPTR
eukprot:129551-Prorocentrum_minimum.AAC.1